MRAFLDFYWSTDPVDLRHALVLFPNTWEIYVIVRGIHSSSSISPGDVSQEYLAILIVTIPPGGLGGMPVPVPAPICGLGWGEEHCLKMEEGEADWMVVKVLHNLNQDGGVRRCPVFLRLEGGCLDPRPAGLGQGTTDPGGGWVDPGPLTIFVAAAGNGRPGSPRWSTGGPRLLQVEAAGPDVAAEIPLMVSA